MRNTLSLWLTGVILLTIAAFLFVFKPITFSPRKDPANAKAFLRPAKVVGDWSPTMAPDPFVTLAGLPVYLYTPQHDLNLGLDLRGGMRVVLQAESQGEFVYDFKDKLPNATAAAQKKGQIVDAVTAALDPDTAKSMQVYVTQEQATIVTRAATQEKADAQLDRINEAMTQVMGKDGLNTTPDREKVFRRADKDVLEKVRTIVNERVNRTGLSEATTYVKEAQHQIVVEIPGVQRPEDVRAMLGKTAEMDFMLLSSDVNVTPKSDKSGVDLSRNGVPITDAEALKTAMLVVRGRDLQASGIGITHDQKGEPAVNFELNSKAAQRFGMITGSNIGKSLAIVLDNKIISAPTIQARITDKGIISGGFQNMDEAKQLSVLLQAGALPVPLTEVGHSLVSASLGADSVARSLMAGLVGLVLVLIFMAAYYRLPGIMANIALVVYIFLSLAVLRFFDATLTLPGIAGIIVSIGMAVDANVIIFERLKEELRTKKPVETAIDVAFSRAWTAIIDSNVASIITGTVLYMLGTGAVKGFAITLLIGVIVSLFTAVTITRLLMKLMVRSKAGHKLAWYGV